MFASRAINKHHVYIQIFYRQRKKEFWSAGDDLLGPAILEGIQTRFKFIQMQLYSLVSNQKMLCGHSKNKKQH
jgi:hypothetical protein